MVNKVLLYLTLGLFAQTSTFVLASEDNDDDDQVTMNSGESMDEQLEQLPQSKVENELFKRKRTVILFLTKLKSYGVESDIDEGRLHMIEKEGRLYMPKALTSLTNEQKDNLLELVSQMSWLKDIDLSGNKIEELPESFGNFPHLTRLNLAKNELEKIPETLSKATNLEELFLSRNKLKSIPPRLGELTKLISLRLDDNQLQTIPIALRPLASHLEQLVLTKNPLQERGNKTAWGKLGLKNVFKDSIFLDR